MASSYFTLPSFARAKKNQEELRKSNPQVPILKDEDEKFLNKQIEAPRTESATEDVPATKITESGEGKPASKEDKELTHEDQLVVPESQPKGGDGVEDPAESVPQASTPASTDRRKKAKGFELPSQEEAEAATRGWDASFTKGADGKDGKASSDTRTWASYLPAMKSSGKKPDDNSTESKTEGEQTDGGTQRNWAQYASSYMPSQLPSLPTWKSKDKDAKMEPVYNDDGTINEEKTKEKQEKEVSVLLDNLNMSEINNRVFALSGETQKIYDRFAQVLKDTINGAPTAYDDMDKLMRDAGPQLEKQFKSMPPFVQTLVKSLPSKIGATLAPELLAAASEKPGADMKAQMAAADKSASGTTTPKTSDAAKKKRKVPGLKALVSKQGAVAGVLRNVVNFLQVRFPFLASMTNIVMSLAVFILMFVFYYCHKRGREVRLEKEKAAAEGEGQDIDEDDEVDASEDEEADDMDELEAKLNQPEPSQVPLPAHEDAKGAEDEAEKAVGV